MTQFPIQTSPTAPWHMWGTTEQFALTIGAGGTVQVVSQQFARVSYRRPENWRFLFTGELVTGIAGVGGAIEVYALFDVQIGVGRSVFISRTDRQPTPLNFQSFCTFHWTVPVGVVPGQQQWNKKWAVEVLAPPVDDAALGTRQVVDHIVAENIQCSARMFIDLAPSPVEVRAELGAYFAPNVHVRPDWYADGPPPTVFRGAETNGA